MNKQTVIWYANLCNYLINTFMILTGLGLIGLLIANVIIFNKIPVCGNRNGMIGWVLISHNCYTVVDNITFYDLVIYCDKHQSVIPNSLDEHEVLIVTSVLGIQEYWMPFTKKRNGWFHGKIPVSVKGDPDKRIKLGKPMIADKEEQCAIYNDGIIEEICTKKHKGICFSIL
ncbi:C-type lectin-like EEV protein [Turkeypox virus]|uniref:C-type lectin-like EEV protein n=1 Tax=Turkeypox virus TaxID=336486 RepID=A0A0M3PBB3_9POXV|nr:C-type lectin-like EEV protein [Turkeypox virus]ALA62520.1 C-type lectin-like EEV protein [Turkeypox virus]